jgi:hypothetical protein
VDLAGLELAILLPSLLSAGITGMPTMPGFLLCMYTVNSTLEQGKKKQKVVQFNSSLIVFWINSVAVFFSQQLVIVKGVHYFHCNKLHQLQFLHL